MRLLEKYNRINLIATIAIFLSSSIAFYYLIHYVLINQIDEDLKIEQNENGVAFLGAKFCSVIFGCQEYITRCQTALNYKLHL